MKINQCQKPVLNRTKLYLLPGLKKYSMDFRKNLSAVFKIAFGIHDIVYPTVGHNIYILVDTRVNTEHFIKMLEWIKDQPFFVAEYEFDNIQDGFLHMFVIKAPSDKAYENFMLSKYSHMYSYKELKTYFDSNSLIIGVLTRDENTVREFVDGLNSEWETKFGYEDWTGEIDYPWREEEEVFDTMAERETIDPPKGHELFEGFAGESPPDYIDA